MKTLLDQISSLRRRILMGLLFCVAGCGGANPALPKTPMALHLSPTERAGFREGILAGRGDVRQHLGADHRRHRFPGASEEAFRCGYIDGLTYDWPAFGLEERIRREYLAYADAYCKRMLHWVAPSTAKSAT